MERRDSHAIMWEAGLSRKDTAQGIDICAGLSAMLSVRLQRNVAPFQSIDPLDVVV